MKVLVMSDSHSDVDIMIEITEKEAPDAIIHLGDHHSDALALKERFENIPLYSVIGNTDKNDEGKVEDIIELCGRRILLTHGHLQQVAENRDGIRNLFSNAVEKYVGIALFGHTHEPYLNWCNGIWIMNPGRLGRKSDMNFQTKYGSGTYGIMYLESDSVKWSFSEVV